MLSFLIYLGSQKWRILSFVFEIEHEYSINTSCNELIFLIVEISEIHESDWWHVNVPDDLEQLIEKIHFEISGYNQIKSEFVRKRYGCNLSMILGYVYNFKSSDSFCSLLAPKMNFFDAPGTNMLVIIINYEITQLGFMTNICQHLFHAELQRFLSCSNIVCVFTKSFFLIFGGTLTIYLTITTT